MAEHNKKVQKIEVSQVQPVSFDRNSSYA